MGGERGSWDERWRARGAAASEVPDAVVARGLERLGAGRGRRAADLACGSGRHAIELARRGWRAVAVDASPVALELVRERARAAGVRVETLEVDLERPEADAEIARGGPLELAVVTRFLDRGLLGRLAGLLAPGGHALVSTFTMDWPGERPSAHRRLERGELARGLPGLETLAHGEEGGSAWILARRPPLSGASAARSE